MPRRLPDRCQQDSVHEFRRSGRQRFDDGLILAGSGQRTGAIYLWGYAAEMILKAAYFSLIGFAEKDVISVGRDIEKAWNHGGKILGIVWPKAGRGHNVRAWAELLIAERAATPGAAYPPAFDREVQRYGQRIGQLWSETLRYHKNLAYLYEVRQVREAAEWFLTNSHVL